MLFSHSGVQKSVLQNGLLLGVPWIMGASWNSVVTFSLSIKL